MSVNARLVKANSQWGWTKSHDE
ncbi:Protein of unknown function [Bacillus mycoides]|nr:Protein of unknown function [Bacillus mycoides]